MASHSTSRLNMLTFICSGLVLLLLPSCHHANRVSPSTLQRLKAKNTPFTLVFGTLDTSTAQVSHPTIRVVRQVDRTSPAYVMWSWSVTSGGRFFAVLQTPPDLPYLDEFYVEVGDPALGFDRVLFVRMQKGNSSTGMYVGDFRISPAPNRTSQGQPMKVEVHDGFEAAAKELKRLYPRFDSQITKAALFLNPVPMAVERR